MLSFLPFVLKSSLRNKRRSVLTLLSIAASLCILGVLMGSYYAFYLTDASEEQALRLVVRNRVSLANVIPRSYQQTIAAIPGVQSVTILQWFGGTYKDNRDPANFFGRIAIEPDKFFEIFTEYRIPEEQKRAFLAERQACVVGRKTADRLNFRIGDRITFVGDIFPVTLELIVRGIYDSDRDNENLYFHYDLLNESLSGQGMRDVVSTFAVRVHSIDDIPVVSKAIDDRFRNSPQQTKTETEKAFEVSFLAFLGNVKAFLMLICAAVTFTILLVSGNTMAMSVRERIREVGILKTLGFTRGKILGLILGESAVLSVLGGLLGLLLANGVFALMRQGPSMFGDVNRFRLSAPVAAACIGVALFVGLVSSLWPAMTASRKSIVEALRYND
ncbi:MAG: ABC transporter permease [Bryobacteraceae bacterium]